MAKRPSLDSLHFGFPWVGGVLRLAGRRVLGLWGLALLGCSPHSKPVPVEDSLTSGRIQVVCATEAVSLVARERDAFQALYPQASIELRAGSCRDAVGALFGARCDLAVLTRELRAEERAAAVRGKLELEGYRFARDAVVVVVNRNNPVQNLTVEDVRRIFAGEASRWSMFGGMDQAIVPVAQEGSTDVTEYFEQQVMQGQPIRARAVPAASDSDVVAEVSSRPGAVGFVSLAWADRGARVVRMASLRGLPYWKPDLDRVYQGDYPLTRFFNLYVRGSGPRLANGLITFITSYDGQKLVQESGRVPTAIPVRFVRRSPLAPAH